MFTCQCFCHSPVKEDENHVLNLFDHKALQLYFFFSQEASHITSDTQNTFLRMLASAFAWVSVKSCNLYFFFIVMSHGWRLGAGEGELKLELRSRNRVQFHIQRWIMLFYGPGLCCKKELHWSCLTEAHIDLLFISSECLFMLLCLHKCPASPQSSKLLLFFPPKCILNLSTCMSPSFTVVKNTLSQMEQCYSFLTHLPDPPHSPLGTLIWLLSTNCRLALCHFPD